MRWTRPVRNEALSVGGRSVFGQGRHPPCTPQSSDRGSVSFVVLKLERRQACEMLVELLA